MILWVGEAHLGSAASSLTFGGPQDYPWFQWEGVTKLRKVIIDTSIIYYSKRIQIKISIGKRHLGLVPGETIHELTVVLLKWNCAYRTSFSLWWCVTTSTEYWQAENLIRAMVSRDCIGAWSCRHGCSPAWLTFVSSPFRNQADITQPNAPTIHDIISNLLRAPSILFPPLKRFLHPGTHTLSPLEKAGPLFHLSPTHTWILVLGAPY